MNRGDAWAHNISPAHFLDRDRVALSAMNGIELSTVWLGELAGQYETLIFWGGRSRPETGMGHWRHDTLREALQGHTDALWWVAVDILEHAPEAERWPMLPKEESPSTPRDLRLH